MKTGLEQTGDPHIDKPYPDIPKIFKPPSVPAKGIKTWSLCLGGRLNHEAFRRRTGYEINFPLGNVLPEPVLPLPITYLETDATDIATSE